MSHLVYIGLGANLNDPLTTVRTAIDELAQITNTQLVGRSRIYISKPMGPADQPDYVNAVVALQTELSPHELYSATSNIEQIHGRTRDGAHWGPRTLDLDILLYGNQQIDDETLTIPHYGLTEREFVVYPILDIDSELVLPCGTKLQDVATNLPFNDMKAI